MQVMQVNVYLGCVLLCLNLSYGAVVPSQGALYRTVKSFIANPEAVASSLGLTRVKRDDDRFGDEVEDGDDDWFGDEVENSDYNPKGTAFSFRGAGVSVDMSYRDESNPITGGELTIVIEESVLVQLFHRLTAQRLPIKKVKLIITYYLVGQDLNFKVSYQIEHGGYSGPHLESGSFEVSWDPHATGGVAMIQVENNRQNAKDFIPTFSIMLQLDYGPEHFVYGQYVTQAGAYVFRGQYDKSSNKALCTADIDGSKRSVEINWDGQFQGVYIPNLNIPTNNYMLNFSGDITSLSFKVSANSKSLFTATIEGFFDLSGGILINYNSSAVGQGEIKYQYEPKKRDDRTGETISNMKIKLSFLSKIGAEYLIIQELEDNSGGLKITTNVTRDSRSVLDIVSQLTVLFNRDTDDYVTEFSMQFHLKDTWGQRFGSVHDFMAKVTTNQRDLGRFHVYLDWLRNKERQSMFKIDTIESIFEFEIHETFLLPHIYEYAGVPKDLKITSSVTALSLGVKKIAGSTKGKIELNGKKVLLTDISLVAKTISCTLNLPNSQSLTANIEWEFGAPFGSLLDIEIRGIETHNLRMGWQVGSEEGTLEVELNGDNTWMGKYEVKCEGKYRLLGPTVMVYWICNTDFRNTPVKTSMDLAITQSPMVQDYVLYIWTEAEAGKAYFKLEHGKISWGNV